MRSKKFRIIAGAALVAVLAAGLMAVWSLALGSDLPPTVVYNHKQKAFVFRNVSPYEGNVYPNLFAEQDFSGMMPGDVVEEEIVVSAEGLNGGYADIFLYAESVNADIGEEEAANFDLLMENAKVLVSWTGKDGSARSSELKAEDGRVHLGTFYDEDQLTVAVDFAFDIEAGNELQNIRAEIGWVFVAEVFENTSPGPPSGPGIPSRPDPPLLETGEHYAYIEGRAENKICPDDHITRAEVVTIFFRSLTQSRQKSYG